MIKAEEFLTLIKSDEAVSPFRLATVDPAYTTGRPKVTFDGESVLSTKAYPYLGSYTPAASHRVLMARVGHGFVVLGRVI